MFILCICMRKEMVYIQQWLSLSRLDHGQGSNVFIFACLQFVILLLSFKGGTAIKTQKRTNTKIFQIRVCRYFFFTL